MGATHGGYCGRRGRIGRENFAREDGNGYLGVTVVIGVTRQCRVHAYSHCWRDIVGGCPQQAGRSAIACQVQYGTNKTYHGCGVAGLGADRQVDDGAGVEGVGHSDDIARGGSGDFGGVVIGICLHQGHAGAVHRDGVLVCEEAVGVVVQGQEFGNVKLGLCGGGGEGLGVQQGGKVAGVKGYRASRHVEVGRSHAGAIQGLAEGYLDAGVVVPGPIGTRGVRTEPYTGRVNTGNDGRIYIQ